MLYPSPFQSSSVLTANPPSEALLTSSSASPSILLEPSFKLIPRVLNIMLTYPISSPLRTFVVNGLPLPTSAITATKEKGGERSRRKWK
ncbi:hypothetical protein BDV97DRAFT_356647 [Delphinella strobiligena]|nr:hypothetical protein BDV97DRAFT_356647 [Delphinella strobiligena]